jgi:hypothetical protein
MGLVNTALETPRPAHRRATGRRLVRACMSVLLLGSLGACSLGGEPAPTTLKISGDCALDDADETDSNLPLTDLISEKTLLHLFGPGDYKAVAGMVYLDRKLPSAYDSRCELTRLSDVQDVLRFALINPKDASYEEAKKTLVEADAPGFTLIDDHTFATTGAYSSDAYVTSILPERVIFIQIMHPAKGVKAIDEAAGVMAELTKSVSGITRVGA